MNSAKPPGPSPAAPRLHFYRNYNRILASAYAVLLLALSAFFLFQLRQGVRDEVALIEGEFDRHAQFLEFVLRSSADEVDSLRMAASALRLSGRGCVQGHMAVRQRELLVSGNGFNRDTVSDRDGSGNLVGVGALAGRSEDFYCDLGTALGLGNRLAAMAFHLPHVARGSFIATQEFQLHYPWQASRDVPWDPGVRLQPLWRLGQAQANPERLKYWVPPYFAGQDLGLLAPVGAPVYAGDRFLGVVAVEMSLDYLNRVNNAFAYRPGMVAVVDAQGRVLAHPGLYADALAVRAAGRFEDAFAASVLPSVDALGRLPQGRAVDSGGAYVIRHGFVSAPWQLVFVVPRAALWHKLLFERGPLLLAVLAALAALMAVTYRVTVREFVSPAARLVDHVAAESSFQPRPIPRVPPAWRPWFEATSRAFGESVQLGSLRRELDIAARMQQSILPRRWPQDPRFTLWGTMQPAREIGGDFFDHFAVADGALGLVVADVSGKGISAGLFAMVSKTLLRSVATQRPLSPDLVLAQVNDALCEDNDESMFVTAVHAHYHPATGALAYANAGHPPPMLLRADGVVHWLPLRPQPALGVVQAVGYGLAQVNLAPGDLLLLFTDGATEAADAQAREFGRERLAALFEGKPVPAAREAVQRVQAAVADHAAGHDPFDDITCMALACNRLGAS